MRKTIILLPAFNEGAVIESVLIKVAGEARREGWNLHIIVADDGSTDNTTEILRRIAASLPLDVITHKMNRGLGETARDLFERAAEVAADGDVILRMDCDDTHEPQYMASLVGKLDEGFDVVIASRFAPGGGQLGVSNYRALVSRGASLFMKVFFPISGVRDYSCGYRAYRASLIRKAIRAYRNDFIQLKGLGFTCTTEKLVKLRLLGARFSEVPFVLRYDQKRSNSKMVSSVTTLGYVVLMVLFHWPWGGWRRGYHKLFRDASSDLSTE